MADRLRDKVALITGAGSGIGRATALLFAVEGAKVAALDSNEEAAAETARLVEERSGEAIALTADVSREEEVTAAVEATVAGFGRLDVLVASAGIDLFVRATETKLEDWERVQSVDLRGVYLCCKYAIPHMERAGGGAIVTLSSVNGLIGVPIHAAYAAAKGGVIALTRQLAVDYGPANIRVNCICPTTTDTPMVRAFTNDAILETLARMHPLRRIAQAEDVAYAALYLASDESRCVAGVILPVDCGWTAQ
jgi:meso-butanediol dehydrogenase/(S,S)-butanediol dehydrogenase/diacetyl reductase